MSTIGFLDVVTFEVLIRPFEVNTFEHFTMTPEEKQSLRKRKRSDKNIKVIDESELEQAKLISKPVPNVRGHTGYLSFARKKLD